jgi:excisionase family DNA binding protein
MLTVTEVAHMLHVHPNTIRLWSKIGVLRAYRIGKRRDYRFNLADVETFLHRDGDGSHHRIDERGSLSPSESPGTPER